MFYIQISIAETDVEEKAKQLKDLQRQRYFLDLEVSRRKGLVKVLQGEIETTQMQQNVKTKLLKKVKRDGLMSALLSTKTEIDSEEQRRQKGSGLEEGSVTSSFHLPMASSVDETTGDFPQEESIAENSLVADSSLVRGGLVGEKVFSPETSQHSIFGFEDSVDALELSEVDCPPQEVTAAASPVSVTRQVGPVVGAERIVDDIHALSSSWANGVIANSLEMMWFVMVAAEDIRPKKIVVRGYVKEVLRVGATTAGSRLVAASIAADELLKATYEAALQKRLEEEQSRARSIVAKSCLEHTFKAALTIVASSQLEAQERQIQVRRALAHELAEEFSNTVEGVGVNAHAVTVVASRRLSISVADTAVAAAMESILKALPPKMMTEDCFAELCESMVVGPIGAALYTIDSKVMKVQRALAKVREKQAEGVVVGAIAVGTGYALAKARKSNKDMAELEIYNLDSQESITHSFPSSADEFKSVGDALMAAAESSGGDMDRVLYGKKMGTVQRVGMIVNGISCLVRTLRTADGITLEALDIMNSKLVSLKLSQEQEKSLDDTRNPVEQMRKILSAAGVL